MKKVAGAVAALTLAGSLLVAAPSVASGASLYGGASGCCIRAESTSATASRKAATRAMALG